MPLPHPDGDFAITAMDSVPDHAWHLELGRTSGHGPHLIAVVPDEEPARSPPCASTRRQGTRTSRTR
ncbi:hypothetical protein [Streptomyces sp. NPDC057386]|uniref:hypothetical protein n=1 Tax=unclassified Streptomyces TaxID=2593676 RepID=UPI0036304A72